MSGKVTELIRHPIKSIGRELLDEATLEVDGTLPWDRTWAIVHEASHIHAATRGWRPSQDFVVTKGSPGLAAIEASLDEATGQITLRHHDLGTLVVDLDDEGDCNRLVEWIKPLVPPNRAQPVGVYRTDEQGLTDIGTPLVSINSHDSLSELSQIAGQDVSMHRWRGNVWVEGFEPREELSWVGKAITIGNVELDVVDVIVRCQATAADPQSGERNLATLDLLESNWGHRNFGVYAKVAKGGCIRPGDTVTIVS